MKTMPPIPFAGSELSEARRVFALFNSADEEYRALPPFIKDESVLQTNPFYVPLEEFLREVH